MFEILYGQTAITNTEFKKFHKGDLIFGEYINKAIKVFKTKEEADNFLKTVKCSYIHSKVSNLWYIEEYGYIEEDSCGTVSIWLAEEQN